MSNARTVGWAIGSGVVAILTVVLAVAGSGWAWLLAIAAVIGALGTLQQVRSRRATQQAGNEAVQRFQQQLLEATERADATEQKRSAALVQLTGEAADLRGRLLRPVTRASR